MPAVGQALPDGSGTGLVVRWLVGRLVGQTWPGPEELVGWLAHF